MGGQRQWWRRHPAASREAMLVALTLSGWWSSASLRCNQVQSSAISMHSPYLDGGAAQACDAIKCNQVQSACTHLIWMVEQRKLAVRRLDLGERGVAWHAQDLGGLVRRIAEGRMDFLPDFVPGSGGGRRSGAIKCTQTQSACNHPRSRTLVGGGGGARMGALGVGAERATGREGSAAIKCNQVQSSAIKCNQVQSRARGLGCAADDGGSSSAWLAPWLGWRHGGRTKSCALAARGSD